MKNYYQINVIKKNIRILSYFIIIFLLTIIIVDVILSNILEKEFYKNLWKWRTDNDINIDSRELGDSTNLFNNTYYGNNFVLWKERGSLYWLPQISRSSWYWTWECNIYWIWDSITYWVWVDEWEEYLSFLAKNYTNTNIYNYGVSWHWIYQAYLTDKLYLESNDKDLIIWQIFNDDFQMFKYMYWRIYNTSLDIHFANGLPILSKLIWNDINNFLLKNSYLYNELLILQTKNFDELRDYENNSVYLLWLLDDFLIRKVNKEEKLLFVFWMDYEVDINMNNRLLPKEYKLIIELLEKYNVPYINLIDEEIIVQDMFTWDNIHFNIKWNEEVSKLIFNKVKDEGLLPNKCY